MNAELISVGTELLLGEILNTDAQYLAKELSDIGIDVYRQTVVGDNHDRLSDAIKTALSRSDIIILSGGLGPTPDDITKEVLAECMEEKLVLDEGSLEDLNRYFAKIGREMTENNKKQAYMPEHCTVLKNHNGTANGCMVEKNGKLAFVLPGPPSELKPMYIESVKPYLQSKSEKFLYSRDLHIIGIGESAVAEKLDSMMRNMTNPTVAPYAKTVGVRLRIAASCADKDEGERMIAPVEKEIRKLIGNHIFGTGDDTIQEVVAAEIKKRGMTISSAESCTGGMFAQMLTEIPGVSDIFRESIVTYANEAKVKYLGVNPNTIDTYGVVSEKTAYEMAKGLCEKTGADVGVGITGVAGPDGGTAENPVGTVYVGVCVNGSVTVKRLQLAGNRHKVRYSACIYAYDMIRRALSEK